jgi:type II secretory pathway component PulL
MSKNPNGCLILGREVAEYWHFSKNEVTRLGSFDHQDSAWTSSLLEKLPAGNKRIFVALDSECVLAAKVSIPPRVRNDNEALAYEAEKHFPILAERMLLTTLPTADDSTFLLVVDREWLAPILESLTASEFQVTCVAPAAILLAQSLPKVSEQTSLEIHQPSRVENLVIGPRSVEQWTVRAARDYAGMDEQFQTQSLKQLCFDDESSWGRAIAQASQNLSSKREKVWGTFELENRSPNQASGAQTWYSTAVVLLISMALVTAALLFRAAQYQEILARVEEKNSEISRQLFPERKRIRSLTRELESERSRLQAMVRASDELLAQQSPVVLLQAFLQTVPEVAGIEFSEIRFMNEAVAVFGKAERLELVSGLANVFRNSGMVVAERKFGTDFEIEITRQPKTVQFDKSRDK